MNKMINFKKKKKKTRGSTKIIESVIISHKNNDSCTLGVQQSLPFSQLYNGAVHCKSRGVRVSGFRIREIMSGPQ
jgi:hypothetical protein